MPPATLPQLLDKTLERVAFTHRSALNEQPKYTISNERLEFLGDAVLELSISVYLYTEFPEEPEGVLTSYRSSLVKTGTLAEAAREYRMGELLVLSKGEEQTGGRENEALLANTFEAYVGALHLDQGFDVADAFIKSVLTPKLDEIRKKHQYKDPKSSLQEFLQSSNNKPPEYVVVDAIGPDHQKEFVIAVVVNGKEIAKAAGRSKQEAQQLAAQNALEILKKT